MVCYLWEVFTWQGWKWPCIFGLGSTFRVDAFDPHFLWLWFIYLTRLSPPKPISYAREFANGHREGGENSIFVGVVALIWIIWCSQNNFVLKKTYTSFFRLLSREYVSNVFGRRCNMRTLGRWHEGIQSFGGCRSVYLHEQWMKKAIIDFVYSFPFNVSSFPSFDSQQLSWKLGD